uniref:Very short patch repair endonuclease n=1 Tax=Candidatus Kentrum sp. MB TaxID=2138164 RepID=A0A451BDW7_9GAMM|nr:MAG: T/G mismatch-specific endonuclease [Candidatus Kentron sp. MB]VFK33872.1 MAG: T/G mismatch-specific endonuclease [Candidatus Kentron sp. MB]VFK76476.1 MAG: T/G mismatch-specific endonuclease [Candidatus Kentron sp. MB]
MTDRLTPEQRRRCMSHVRGRDTKPELLLRKCLWARGARYRLHVKLPGKPDPVFPGKRLAVFVDGCFWHGCLIHGKISVSNRAFWEKKLHDNVSRDRQTDARLVEMGWWVLRIWTHEIKQDVAVVVERVMTTLQAQHGNFPSKIRTPAQPFRFRDADAGPHGRETMGDS